MPFPSHVTRRKVNAKPQGKDSYRIHCLGPRAKQPETFIVAHIVRYDTYGQYQRLQEYSTVTIDICMEKKEKVQKSVKTGK